MFPAVIFFCTSPLLQCSNFLATNSLNIFFAFKEKNKREQTNDVQLKNVHYIILKDS